MLCNAKCDMTCKVLHVYLTGEWSVFNVLVNAECTSLTFIWRDISKWHIHTFSDQMAFLNMTPEHLILSNITWIYAKMKLLFPHFSKSLVWLVHESANYRTRDGRISNWATECDIKAIHETWNKWLYYFMWQGNLERSQVRHISPSLHTRVDHDS